MRLNSMNLRSSLLVLSFLVGLIAVFINPVNAATDTPTCQGESATIVVQPGETLVEGTEEADVIVHTGFTSPEIHGRGGDDLICVSDVAIATVHGGDGDDIITIQGHQGHVYGGPGHDTITVNGIITFVSGGSGNDFIDVPSGIKEVYGNIGNNTFKIGSGLNTIIGGPNDDTVTVPYEVTLNLELYGGTNIINGKVQDDLNK